MLIQLNEFICAAEYIICSEGNFCKLACILLLLKPFMLKSCAQTSGDDTTKKEQESML